MKEIKSFYEKQENIQAWGGVIRDMYEKEDDETRKQALYVALNVMNIKIFKEATEVEDTMLSCLMERSENLAEAYKEVAETTSRMKVKIYALLVLQAIVVIGNLIAMIVKL